MNIKTIDFSYKNDNGHRVYEFYPDRNFDAEIVVCPWFGEIKCHHMLPAIFAICDEANIKVSVLDTEDHIPLFSFYAHELICVSNEFVKHKPGCGAAHEADGLEKLKYFKDLEASQSEKVFPNGLKSISNPIRDVYGKFTGGLKGECKDGSVHDSRLWSLVTKGDRQLFIEALKNKMIDLGYSNLSDFITNLWHWNEKFVHDFYSQRVDEYNLFFTQDQILSYDNYANDMIIDDSPKIWSFVKSGQIALPLRLKQDYDKGFRRLSSEIHYHIELWLGNQIMKSLEHVSKSVGSNQIINCDFVSSKTKRNLSWPKCEYINKRELVHKRYKNSFSAIQILLSLKNNLAFASVAGSSSFLYLMPVNILYAEHVHFREQYCHGQFFSHRPFQKLFENESAFNSASPAMLNENRGVQFIQSDGRGCKMKGDFKFSNEEVLNWIEESLNETRSLDFFNKMFLDYLEK